MTRCNTMLAGLSCVISATAWQRHGNGMATAWQRLSRQWRGIDMATARRGERGTSRHVTRLNRLGQFLKLPSPDAATRAPPSPDFRAHEPGASSPRPKPAADGAVGANAGSPRGDWASGRRRGEGDLYRALARAPHLLRPRGDLWRPHVATSFDHMAKAPAGSQSAPSLFQERQHREGRDERRKPVPLRRRARHGVPGPQEYIVDSDHNSYLSFDAWLKLVKAPGPENVLATLEDSESSTPENPISAPMHMPGAGIDDVMAGRVEQGVMEPGGSLVPRRPDQISSPAQAQRPRPESTCTD